MSKSDRPRPEKPMVPPSVRDRLSADQKRRLDEALSNAQKILEEALPPDATFEEHERAVLEITNDLARRELERKLQSMADRYAMRLHIEHNEDWHGWRAVPALEYRRHQPGTAIYHSLVGGLRVRRYTYRERVRNGVTYVPLELEAGLMEHMTPALARATTYAFALMPIRDVDQVLRLACLQPPSRSTLDRSARDLGAYAIGCHDEIEPRVRATEVVPPGTHAIVLGTDRTSVRMRNDDTWDFRHRRDLRRPRPKRRRLGARREGVAWHMDYVATVTFVDGHGERIASRSYRVPAHEEPRPVVARMMEDVSHALAQQPSLKLSIVQDGAPELWSMLRESLRAVPAVGSWHEVLDWFHVAERLALCAELCCSDPIQRTRQCSVWKRMLLEQRDGTASFLRSLARRRHQVTDADAQETLNGHLAYFRRRREQLCYRRTRQLGLPIGSGVTEGCCKSLVGTRAKRSGQHWTQRGLSAALHWRTIVASDRFDRTWSHFAERYRATTLRASA